jgi:hypothetical protein
MKTFRSLDPAAANYVEIQRSINLTAPHEAGLRHTLPSSVCNGPRLGAPGFDEFNHLLAEAHTFIKRRDQVRTVFHPTCFIEFR